MDSTLSPNLLHVGSHSKSLTTASGVTKTVTSVHDFDVPQDLRF